MIFEMFDVYLILFIKELFVLIFYFLSVRYVVFGKF